MIEESHGNPKRSPTRVSYKTYVPPQPLYDGVLYWYPPNENCSIEIHGHLEIPHFNPNFKRPPMLLADIDPIRKKFYKGVSDIWKI